jgi:hypothetical protein
MPFPKIGAKPLDLDVQKILDAYSTMKVGDVIAYTTIKKLLGMKYITIEKDETYTGREIEELLKEHDRFWSVTAAWRKKVLRHHNYRIRPNGRNEFERCSEIDRVYDNAKKVMKGSKTIVRAAGDLNRVQTTEMSESERHTADYARNKANRLAEHVSEKARELPISSMPIQPQLPRRRAGE